MPRLGPQIEASSEKARRADSQDGAISLSRGFQVGSVTQCLRDQVKLVGGWRVILFGAGGSMRAQADGRNARAARMV